MSDNISEVLIVVPPGIIQIYDDIITDIKRIDKTYCVNKNPYKVRYIKYEDDILSNLDHNTKALLIDSQIEWSVDQHNQLLNSVSFKYPKIKKVLIYSDGNYGNLFIDKQHQPFKNVPEFYKKVGYESLINEYFLYEESDISFNFYYNLLLSDKSDKLYIIVAPSGYGKSTLIDNLTNSCVHQLTKITTRAPRSLSEKSIKCVTQDYFKALLREDMILAPYMYKGQDYGIEKEEFEKIFKTNRLFVMDTTNFNSAQQLKSLFPNNVKLVSLFPSVNFAGFGLEKRIQNLLKLPEKFDEYADELEFISRKKTIEDTHHRLKKIAEEARAFQRNIPYFDINLINDIAYKNLLQLTDEMTR